MSYGAHKMPHLGALRPGVWFGSGFGGHGLNTTAVAGRLLAGAITGDDDRWRWFAPFGLEWTGGPLLGPLATQAMYWAYQAQDRVQEWRSRAVRSGGRV
jgi:gamma-glutamylputrescine oxidase